MSIDKSHLSRYDDFRLKTHSHGFWMACILIGGYAPYFYGFFAPTGGAFILLTILCNKYARGFETSYLLLQPASLIMGSFATLLDTVTAMFGSYIVAVKTKMVEHHTIKHFI